MARTKMDKLIGARLVDARSLDKTDGRWEPVRRGRVYCSPGCGAGCTWADHKKATREAAALRERLGRGWKPFVWENLGWHWIVGKGDPGSSVSGKALLEVHCCPRGRRPMYSAWLQTGPQFISRDFPTPEQALADTRRMVREGIRNLTTAFEAAFNMKVRS
jgi:hypothetical protein